MEAATTPQAAPSIDQPEVREREISLEDVQREEEVPAAEPQQAPEPPEDVVDVLVPKAEPKLWQFGPNGEFEFVQRPLSFIAKMQWFSLVGDVLDKALSGENAMSLNSLFDAPGGRGGSLTMADFADADTFVQAVGKLLNHAPKFLTDSYCIWLGVPDYQKDLVSQVMAQPEADGGLSDDQGIEIIEVFIDQNYEALDVFFREKVAVLRKRVQARSEAASSSRQSRR